MVGTEGEMRLSLMAEPDSVAAARRAISELAEQLGFVEPALGDLQTIVSEACSNVVRHAYPEVEGSFELEVLPAGDTLTIVVRDSGAGMRPLVQTEHSSLRLGLGLISTLSSHFEISDSPGGGTEVLMQVPLPS
ncbi:MAG TPA: ATP-binding protein [Solirubrobacterales bacterium]|jgi:anti-sigma regulatory factor (Ser/Thr protein kinase)|nr:ATP-binding protein [Solirubrobacterales bacterium]